MNLLCTHFSRKVAAVFESPKATVKFPFGLCYLTINESGFYILGNCKSEVDKVLLKYVLADHISRFGIKDGIKVIWK